MKKTNKPKKQSRKLNSAPASKSPSRSKERVIKELATQFEEELKNTLPITVLPDGSVVYKNYLIKQLTTGNWGLYSIKSRDLVEQYYLKTSAIMAAKAYNNVYLEKFFEIKRLDDRYWANYSNNLIYRRNMQSTVDFSKYLILLNKLEDSQEQTEQYKSKISKMFKWSFA
jgi:hypothetical protein